MMIDAVFEGGGIKGLSYIGAISFFEERGITFFRVGGTSVGALFASLIATGFKSNEMKKIVENLDYKILKPNNISYLKAIKEKGLYSSKELEIFLDNLYLSKGKRYFGDLKYGNDYLLKIVATDITSKRMIVIPNDLTRYGINPDNFKIASGVVMSSSLPFVYKPYKINNHLFFDGGIVSNYPANYLLFENDDLPIVGFRFMNKITPSVVKKAQKKIFKIGENYNYPIYKEIYINTLNIKSTEFKKGFNIKNDLYYSGYQAAKEFFYANFVES